MNDLSKMTTADLEKRKAEMEQSLSLLFAQVGTALPDLEREYAAIRDELARRTQAAPRPAR